MKVLLITEIQNCFLLPNDYDKEELTSCPHYFCGTGDVGCRCKLVNHNEHTSQDLFEKWCPLPKVTEQDETDVKDPSL